MQCRLPKKIGTPGGGTTPSTVAVTIAGSPNSSYGYVTIDGTNYSSAQTLEVEIGTSIVVTATGSNPNNNSSYCSITLNGATVAAGTREGATYTLTAESSATITFSAQTVYGQNYYSADITTE